VLLSPGAPFIPWRSIDRRGLSCQPAWAETSVSFGIFPAGADTAAIGEITEIHQERAAEIGGLADG
jgi:hypothetical protein